MYICIINQTGLSPTFFSIVLYSLSCGAFNRFRKSTFILQGAFEWTNMYVGFPEAREKGAENLFNKTIAEKFSQDWR
jgi:hypothetical protein